MTYIAFYKFLFIIELSAAEFLFTFRLKKRRLYPLRLAAGIIVLLGFAAIPIPTDTVYFTCAEFLLLFGLSLPVLMLCYDESFLGILFCAMAAYTCQHFAYELTNLVTSLVERGTSPLLGMYSSAAIDFSAMDKSTLFSAALYLACYVASYWLAFGVFGRRIRGGEDMKIRNLALFALIGAGLLADIVISSIVTYYLADDFAGATLNYATNLLCCMLILACQFGQLSTRAAERELDVVRHMWQQDKEQYGIARSNIDLINIKCHDMRHKVRELTAGKSLSDEEIAEIERSISVYDSAMETGNEALDVILTEKSLRCGGSGIRFTCMADGGALSFMSDTDIYSLFGNIMDNAIEAAEKVPDEDGRTIELKVSGARSFVSVTAANSYVGEIKFGSDGLPVTTKAEKDYHGFGVKSIAYLVEKYGGNLSIEAENGVFELNILFNADGSAE